MVQYNAWNPINKFNPRQDSPAFQREWSTLQTGVLAIADDSGNQQTIVSPTSSTGGSDDPDHDNKFGTSGTIYIWGISFASESADANGGKVEDSDGNLLTVAVGNCAGPFFLQLSTPMRVDQNSGVYYNQLVYKAGSYITVYYTNSQFHGGTN